MRVLFFDKKKALAILVLLLLALNDHFLKYQYPGWITGKLSDVSGLFVFPFFLACIFPKIKVLVYVFTAVLFIWWKSLLSQFVIDSLNLYIPYSFNINRTIDYSDLITLPVILISWKVFQGEFNLQFNSPVFKKGLIVFASISFTSTTIIYRPVMINKEYKVKKTKEEILNKWKEIDSTKIKLVPGSGSIQPHFSHILITDILLQPDSAGLSDTVVLLPTYKADIFLYYDTLGLKPGVTSIYFKSIDNWPPGYGPHYFESKRKYRKWFKSNYIDVLR